MTSDLLQRMARTLSNGLASTPAVPADDEALYAWVADHLAVRLPRRACCLRPASGCGCSWQRWPSGKVGGMGCSPDSAHDRGTMKRVKHTVQYLSCS
jgi:hypothetical protein